MDSVSVDTDGTSPPKVVLRSKRSEQEDEEVRQEGESGGLGVMASWWDLSGLSHYSHAQGAQQLSEQFVITASQATNTPCLLPLLFGALVKGRIIL